MILGAAFTDIKEMPEGPEKAEKMAKAVRFMENLAGGARDAVSVTLLLQLGVNVPFKAPKFDDLKANDEYWPKISKWANGQLYGKTPPICQSCKQVADYKFFKEDGSIRCGKCGAEKPES